MPVGAGVLPPPMASGRERERARSGRARWIDGQGNGDAPPPGLVPEDPSVGSEPPPPQGLEAFSADPLVPLDHPLGKPDRQRDRDGLIPTREARKEEMGGAKIGDLTSGKTTGFGGPVNIGRISRR